MATVGTATANDIAKQNLAKYGTSDTLGSSTGTGTTQNSAKTTLSQNYTTFLKMLTTQLQNQDPLEPMDSAQFTQQLVQYSSVEQAISSNEKLDKLISLNQASGLGTTLGYIGKEVETSSSTLPLNNGAGEFTYTLKDSVTSNTLVISDKEGSIIRTLEGSVASGKKTVTWDGKDNNGKQVADGDYQINVIAKKTDGSLATVGVTTFGLVSGAETTTDGNVLNVGGSKIGLSDILSIRTPKTASSS